MSLPAPRRLPGALLLFLLPLLAPGFYIPGIAPTDYEEGAPVDIFASKLQSTKTHVPFDYYYLPFCKPFELSEKKKIKSAKHLNLGQILSGERYKPTNFSLNMKVDEKLTTACSVVLDAKSASKLTRLIENDYFVHLNMDNMPAVTRNPDGSFTMGYQLGRSSSPASSSAPEGKNKAPVAVNNVLSITVLIHELTPSKAELYQPASEATLHRIVGFEVASRSEGPDGVGGEVLVKEGAKVEWKYEVKFVASPIRWATRWDPLLAASVKSQKIQWFSIVNSLLISVFLTGVIASILLRTVYLDFARYNNMENDEDLEEDFGWKLVHGDVFRVPNNLELFAVLHGTGVQLVLISTFTVAFAFLGFLSPANRGGFLTALLTVWGFSGAVCGFFAASLYAGLEGKNKRLVTLGSALFFPGIAFTVFFVFNVILWYEESTGGVPFTTLLILLGLWFVVAVPLNVIGAYFGYSAKPYEFPVRTNQIPREIPRASETPLLLLMFASSILPFFIVFIELTFIMTSLWNGAVFYMFGFLSLVLVILMVACAEVAIGTTYFSLTRENYRWWWRSYGSTACIGIYIFAYCAIFLLGSHEKGEKMHLLSSVIFLGYSFVMSLAAAFVTGTVGFVSSFYFVRTIYSKIRVD